MHLRAFSGAGTTSSSHGGSAPPTPSCFACPWYGANEKTVQTLLGRVLSTLGAQIADTYPVLEPGGVYAILAWYLANRPEVGRYLAERRLDAEKLRAEIEASVGRPPVVERLSAMQAERRGV